MSFVENNAAERDVVETVAAFNVHGGNTTVPEEQGRLWGGRRPHLHGNKHVRPNESFPEMWNNDCSVGVDEIVFAFCNARTNVLDVQKGLFDEILHSLDLKVRYRCR